MKRIFQKLGMIVAMLLSFITASAYDFEVDGIYYNITSMSNLEVEVSASDFTDVNISMNWCWKNNTPYSGDITIPTSVNYNNRTFTVTGIGKAAFGYPQQYYSGQINFFDETRWGVATNIKSIVLPSTIENIDDMAFQGCSLESIIIPEAVKNIGIAAFAHTKISSVKILSEDVAILKSAFYGSSISTLILGKAKQIGDKCFASCPSLMEVFCTSSVLPVGLSPQSFTGSHSALEVYVPSVEVYGFGKKYISFINNSYVYTGVAHNIEWSNNLKAYKCEISESECKTEIKAGTYTKNLKATYSNGVDLTVEIPYTYTINKAPLALAVNDMQREYGDQNPAFTCNISGFVNGETEQSIGVTPSFECEATQLSNVGTYRILASLEAPNYEVTYKYGTLSVLKAPLSVSMVNTTRIYGDKNPEFEFAYTGLKNGEVVPVWNVKPTINTTANQQSSVGEYVVNVSGGEAKNYDITTYNPGTLTVSKRNLTAKANDCERLYGENNPEFKISYVGFVNGDDKSSLSSTPTAECSATKESNAGKYPISVTGGLAENYYFVYQDGQLTVNPLTVGFKDVYNYVTYNDMSVSTTDRYFNFIPEITGPFSEDDFYIELWFLDGDNRYDNHVATISGGDYAGKYVNTNTDRQMWAGKYIFNLTSKGTNPNVVANPSRAYVTVNRASNNLEWNSGSPIVVGIGDKVDLGISYQADLWCSFNTDYDKELIELSSDGETGNSPHWYATGLKEGETTLYFSIECKKNDMGFYNFTNSRTLSKRIKVVASSGIEGVISDDNFSSVIAKDGSIYVLHKDDEAIVRVFSLQGTMVAETSDDVIDNLPKGLYIVTVDTKSFKILL